MMQTLVHLSDLHFGRVNEGIAEALIRQVNDLHPDVTVVSGDLTQRARSWQFEAARTFLEQLPKPQIVVPGNHDVPAYNLFRRFHSPLGRFRRYISDDPLPSFVNDGVAVFGLNSTLSLTTKHGRLRPAEIAMVCDRMTKVNDKVVKVVVCHHPFDLPPNVPQRDLIRGAAEAMRRLAECQVDIILSGHLHLSHTSYTSERYKIAGHSALLVQAGTATSNRERGEVNSFNVLRIDQPQVEVEQWVWNADRLCYERKVSERFVHQEGEWRGSAERKAV
jgi:3',5'-cyclic AMP phosphodiesterase CpdA